MEKIRYIDLLLTLRSEYLKLKDNFDGIIDDIEVKKPFRKELVSLSKEKKFTSVVKMNLPFFWGDNSRLQLVTKIEKKDKYGYPDIKFKNEYDIIEDNDINSIIPAYRLVDNNHKRTISSTRICSSFGSTNVKPLLESELFKLSDVELKRTFRADEGSYMNERIYCGFPFIHRSLTQNPLSDYNVGIDYDYQKNELIFIIKNHFPKVVYSGNFLPAVPIYTESDIGKFLTDTVESCLLSDDWKDFLVKHLVVCDKKILVDDVDYEEKVGRPKKLTTKELSDYKSRVLVLEGRTPYPKYKIRL